MSIFKALWNWGRNAREIPPPECGYEEFGRRMQLMLTEQRARLAESESSRMKQMG